jgi:hypothetical protein
VPQSIGCWALYTTVVQGSHITHHIWVCRWTTGTGVQCLPVSGWQDRSEFMAAWAWLLPRHGHIVLSGAARQRPWAPADPFIPPEEEEEEAINDRSPSLPLITAHCNRRPTCRVDPARAASSSLRSSGSRAHGPCTRTSTGHCTVYRD